MNKKLAPKGKKASGKVTFDATGINLTSQAGLVPASKFLKPKGKNPKGSDPH